MKKLIIFIVLVVSTLMVANMFFANSNSIDARNKDKLKVFTKSDLLKYNGKNGAKIFVAVDGYVYDLTHSKKWKNGSHMGQHEAGEDMSKAILRSPHGKKKLKSFPVVGIYKK
jgi:predicted heme/steroid binding protein